MPDPPQAEVPRRPKSLNDLRPLQADFVPPQLIDSETAAKIGEVRPILLPPRPKSRNDLYDLKAGRSARRVKGLSSGGRRGREEKFASPLDLASIKDELDFADWYGQFEDQLEDTRNAEYR